MITNGMNTLISLAVAGFIPLLIRLIGVAKAQKINHNLAATQGFAENVVLAIQQQLEGADTQEKYNKAEEWLSGILTAHKIPFTAEELNVLIESSIKTLKNDFADKWKTAIAESADSQDIIIKQEETKMNRDGFYQKYKAQIDAVGATGGDDIATSTDKFMHNVEHYGEAGFDVYPGMTAITPEERAAILADIALIK